MNHFAPVFIPTLNRYQHFKRCVESLAKCTNAEKTELYISLDYPANETHWDGYKKIKSFLHKIKGFKNVIIIKHNENYGFEKNYFEGQKEIFRKHEKIIFSEDDNEFSPNFLDYINKGLYKYKDDYSILAICGYNYPIAMPKSYSNNFYLNKSFSAWGYATWKNRNLKLIYSTEEIIRLIKNKKFLFESFKNYGLSKLLTLLIAIKQGKPKYGDGALTITMLKENKYCVFPTVSKVRNSGHDGSGVHCGNIKDSIYIKQQIDNNTDFCYTDIYPIIDNNINKKVKKYFVLKFRRNLKCAYEYFLFLFKHTLTR